MNDKGDIDQLEFLFWGKKERRRDTRPSEPGSYHPLLFHMIDTANVAKLIWENVVPKNMREHIASVIGSDDLEKKILESLS